MKHGAKDMSMVLPPETAISEARKYAATKAEHDLVDLAEGFLRSYRVAGDALREITKIGGRFSTDRLQHATNTIEDMAAIAAAALKKARVG